MYLQKKIRMCDEKGKWRPYNIEDNTEHDCKKQKNGNDINLDLVIKKLASIGITIDLEKLRNI